MKLPATVAFPTDEQLLKRLEESRRALPPNSVKALRNRREPLNDAASVRRLDGQSAPKTDVTRAATDKPAVPAEARPVTLQLVRIEELYLRNKVALGQR